MISFQDEARLVRAGLLLGVVLLGLGASGCGWGGGDVDGRIPDWLEDVQRHPEEKALGDPSAPVTIVEYMDFQCPACARFSANTLPRIVRNHVATGEVYYMLRHFPITRHHPQALPAASASECAADQGAFWPFKLLAVRNQKRLSEDLYLAIGRRIGLEDFGTFRECVSTGQHQSRVENDRWTGRMRQVEATPTLLVDGQALVGPSYREVARAIRTASP